ncbi:MAG: hypothetical protein Q9173_005781 [Seirophora scorigena]
MAPREKPKAKRRWTMTRSQDLVEESSEEDYGEEILPTVDQDALATLAPEDQDKFRKMRKKDRKNVIARWRREGKPVPGTGITISHENSQPLARSSSAPQLPELQMDVTPRGTFSSAFDNVREPSPGIEHQSILQRLRPEQSDPKGNPHSQQGHHSLPANPHDQGLTHLPVSTLHDHSSAHTSLIAYPSLDSEDIGQGSLWLRILDNTEHTRGRRGTRGPSQDPTDPTAEVSRSNRQETPEARRLRQLQEASSTVRDVTDHADLEYARFCGYGPVPPGLALGSNIPSASERVHARAVTSVNDVLRSTGRVPAHDAVAVARRAANQVQVTDPSKSEFLVKRENLFVRPNPQDITTMNTCQEDALIRNTQLSPLTTVKSQRYAKPNPGATTGHDDMHESQNNTEKLKISPMKRMTRAVGAGLRGLCKGKAEKAKQRDPSRRLSRLRLHDEARLGTAAMVSPPITTFFPYPRNTSTIMQAPVVVMNTQAGDRQTGRKAQISNITAAKTVADIIRSCLGPNAMLKMLLDPMGGIALTNDGHAILREIEVAHPAAKNMIELSRTQDEEVGDGTTTVIILAGEILAQALPQLERNIHPVVIISAFKRALNDALNIVGKVSVPVDITNDQQMYRLISSAIDTKYAARWSQMMCSIALKAVRTVSHDAGGGKKEVDIKRYAKVEKVPGGQIEDSKILDGVMLNKDITHPKMRRRIENPRVVLLDCPLEYKKGESQTNIEISKEDDWNRILQIEEEQVKIMTDAIIAVKPDVVITEKGVSDLAQHFLVKHNITALRRVRKTDNNRIARATGATIVNRVEDLQESDVGVQCGLFEIEKIGDEYFTFITKCKGPKACTILLRGPSKDLLNEIERNLQDAMLVARNVVFHPRLSPGGGATEMAVSVQLAQLAKEVEGVQQWPYKAVAEAMEIIPRTLIQNSGSSPIRVLTKLRAKHAEGQHTWGIDGYNGTVVDMKQYGTWEPEAVKLQSIKTAVEVQHLY